VLVEIRLSEDILIVRTIPHTIFSSLHLKEVIVLLYILYTRSTYKCTLKDNNNFFCIFVLFWGILNMAHKVHYTVYQTMHIHFKQVVTHILGVK